MMICLDANCVIYLIEKNPLWGPKVVARLATAKVTISEPARREVLQRPLKLSHQQRYAEEVKQGLHGKRRVGGGKRLARRKGTANTK